jgi:hypothetical protein
VPLAGRGGVSSATDRLGQAPGTGVATVGDADAAADGEVEAARPETGADAVGPADEVAGADEALTAAADGDGDVAGEVGAEAQPARATTLPITITSLAPTRPR